MSLGPNNEFAKWQVSTLYTLKHQSYKNITQELSFPNFWGLSFPTFRMFYF